MNDLYIIKQRTLLFILLLIGFITRSVVYGQSGVIKGRVFNPNNNEPLPFTNLVIKGTRTGSTSDLDGNFLFTGLKPGYVQIEASSVGYEKYLTEEIMVTNAKTVLLDIPMKEAGINLQQVEITAGFFQRTDESPLSLRSLGVSEIERYPGGNRDVSRVIQSLPGVSSTPAYRNDVIVRGGGAAENSFYLDGVEIPNLNHFSTQGASGGPVGIINIDFIREVNLYTGAFPANRGNALSSILEFRQIDGSSEKWNGRFAFGASDLALTLNGPVTKKSTLIFSARRSYLQFLFSALGLPFLPTYNDFQLKYKYKFDQKNELTVLGLGAIDKSKLNTGIENPDESQRYLLGYLPVDEQWNYTIGAVYKHFHKKGYTSLVLSRNMLNNRSYKYLNNDDSDDSNKIFDYLSQESENKIRIEHTSTLGAYRINYGAGMKLARYTNETSRKTSLGDSVFNIRYNSLLYVFGWNIFGQISRSFLKDKLTLSLGIRTDAADFNKEMANPLSQISPRFSASYKLTDKLLLNFNTGRFYQQPPYTALGFRNNNGELVNKDNRLKYIVADHVVAGIEFDRNDNSQYSIEGFYKHYSAYPFSVSDSICLASKGAGFGTYGDEELISTAKGRAYGLEVLLRDRDFFGFNYIISYTLVRSEFTGKSGKYISSAWDNIHILNLTLQRTFKYHWNIGIKWRLVGGAPYTPADLQNSSYREVWDARGRAYPDYNRFNTERLKPFHQLDVRIDKQFFFKRWSLMLYADVQNVYGFKAQSAPEYTNLTPEGEINISPSDPDKYVLRKLDFYSGTVLPTIGIIIEL